LSFVEICIDFNHIPVSQFFISSSRLVAPVGYSVSLTTSETESVEFAAIQNEVRNEQKRILIAGA
jgi:hypothetical protein